jgi:hypothetical protein
MRSTEKENTSLPTLSVLEAETLIGNDVTLQRWFTRQGADVIRTEIYRFEDGSVVAYQDCINGVNSPLRMDQMFKALYEDEPAFWTILHFAGIMDPRRVETYCTGR